MTLAVGSLCTASADALFKVYPYPTHSKGINQNGAISHIETVKL
jgi:hypothetical protein